MTTARGELQGQVLVALCGLPDPVENGWWEKGVILRTHQERWHSDLVDETNRARLEIVVVRVQKSVKWSRDQVVEVPEGARGQQSPSIDEVRVPLHLLQCLFGQRVEKVSHVAASKAPF